MRTTRKQIEGTFKVWVQLVGGHIASSYNDAGGYALDYAACYGGWRIVQMTNPQGGQQDVTSRMPATQFWEALHFAIRTLEESRRTQEVTR